jgi:hypothetical protein
MSNLISRSTSQTVAENSLATAIAFPESSDTDFASSALLVAVTALPSDGMVVLADGITPVTLGETLTVAQLIGLKFRPTLDSFGTTSTFAFSVSDPAGNPAASTSTKISAPADTSSGPSALTVRVTAIPSNVTILLADDVTPVHVGKTLTVRELTALRFRPALNVYGQSSSFAFTVSNPAGVSVSVTAALTIRSTITPPLATWASLGSMNDDDRSMDEGQQHFQRALAEPGPRPDVAEAIVTNASNRGQSAHVTTDAYVPVDANHARAGEALARGGPSASSLQANDTSSFLSTTGCATAAVFDTTSLLSIAAGTASPATQSMTVTTDKVDYAPGSTATFIVAGLNPGSSVVFQIADLAADPGINGIADVYAPFSVADGGTGDADGLANGTVIARWQVPADGSATGATLQLTATSVARPRSRRSATRPTRS